MPGPCGAGNHMVEKLLGARLYEYEGKDNPPWTCWLSQIQCELVCVLYHLVDINHYSLFVLYRSAQHHDPWYNEINTL